jgi:putative ABC transport system permease protein
VCFLALLYVQFELNRDSYNLNADNIYRLVTDVKTPVGVNYESTSAPMAPALQAAFPQIKEAARIFMDDMIIQSTPDNAIKEEIAYADSSAFKVFTWPLLRGDIRYLFRVPFNVVLTESAAKKYFGKADPMGQTLLINGKDKATVTGVMKDIPYDSHLRVDMLFSMSTLVNADWDHNWTRFGFYTYLLMKPGQDIGRFEAKLPSFVKTNIDQSQLKYKLTLEPLKKVYLYGKPRGHRTGASASGSITNVYVISVIAVLVLFIACFNFVNLTTAFSLQRAKEIAVRKVLGASRGQLIFQFFMDSVLLCLISFGAALLITALCLPLFNQLTGTVVSSGIFEHTSNLALLFGLTVIVALLSGTYPALSLSGFNAAKSLKNNMEPAGSGSMLRKALVVSQFSISIFLIIATIVVYRQLDFMQNQELGFQKDHKLVIDYQFDQRITNHADAIKQRIATIPGVSLAALSSTIPGNANNQYNTVLEDRNGEKRELRTDAYFVDDDFLKQYQLTIVAGRNFSKGLTADTLETMLINETMAKTLGFENPQQAIGKHFTQLHHDGTIIGVVQDFHFHSFMEKIQPLTLRLNPWNFSYLTINISSQNTRSTVSQIEAAWKEIVPGLPFVYFFSDEAYDHQYAAQERFGKLFIYFAVIAIAISCLGLLGLSAFSAVRRKKEIGMRKVLGATVSGITLLLSMDFVKLVVIALLIASPLSWWIMNNWLQGFAYRITIPLWAFIASGIAAIIIALLTVGFNAVKAAIANPVKSLKSE